ncbi:NADPH-dependent FMN reductase [Rhodobacteraceae bacterium DSL-40]|uniref:NADPH-dependent FMN reductase n=1 Tax=Amaricoccus sp. B4 TaxID=3368557 RepID=UPI000DAE6224
MRFLAISGSARRASTNTALLAAVAELARPAHEVTVFSRLADLPVFSPDREAEPLPARVQAFADLIRANDGVILSSPEYVRAIPGGLKNAIDWLVSRDEIVAKPIALLHASHRGDDMLAQLRLVLSTVSQRFATDLFLRFAFMKLAPDDIAERMARPENRAAVAAYLEGFASYCRR